MGMMIDEYDMVWYGYDMYNMVWCGFSLLLLRGISYLMQRPVSALHCTHDLDHDADHHADDDHVDEDHVDDDHDHHNVDCTDDSHHCTLLHSVHT